ncbi:MAG: hypothetical protein OEY14_00240 [Myxococcales bacterium]|nr:hypothetical protein [Myxococcales bacterium]
MRIALLALISGCALDLEALEGLSLVDADGLGARSDASVGPRESGAPPSDGGREDVREAAADESIDGSARFDAEPEAAAEITGPAPSCGLPGLPCCTPDARCGLGTCLRGRCAAFGGLQIRSPSCADPCPSRNLYTAGCSCPRGFEEGAPTEIQIVCDGTMAGAELSFCAGAGRLPGSDYGGSFLLLLECGGGCARPNAFTGSCSCPSGSSPIRTRLEVPSSCGPADAELVLCIQAEAPTITFAGAYQLGTSPGPGCGPENPLTGACVCPEGSATQILPVVSDRGSASVTPIFVCSR